MRTILGLALLAGPALAAAAPAGAVCPVWYDQADPAQCAPVGADGTLDAFAAGVRCEIQPSGPDEYLLFGGPVVVPGATSVTFSCFAHELLVEETHPGSVGYMESRTLTYVSYPMFICTQVYWTSATGGDGSAVFGCYWS